MDLFFTARRLSAEESPRRRLAGRGAARAQGFSAAVDEIARGVAANAPLTLKAAKAAVRAAAGLPDALSAEECEALAAACFDSADYVEGRTAFLEKRAPKFSGS